MADAFKNLTLNSVHSLNINNINVSETGFVSVIRCGGERFYSAAFVRSLDHSSTSRNDSMSSVPHRMVNVNTHILAQANISIC